MANCTTTNDLRTEFCPQVPPANTFPLMAIAGLKPDTRIAGYKPIKTLRRAMVNPTIPVKAKEENNLTDSKCPRYNSTPGIAN